MAPTDPEPTGPEPTDPDPTDPDPTRPDPTQPDRPVSDEAVAPARRGGQGRTLLIGVGLVVAMLVIAVAFISAGAGPPDGGAPQGGGPVVVAPPGTEPGSLGLSDAVEQLPDATLGGFGGAADVAVAELLGGSPLVVNFWATWCAPCVAEMPDLQRLHEAGGEAIRLVGINTQDAAVNAEPFADELDITYDLLVDRDGSYFTATGSFGMPTTLLVHPDGRVAYRHTGPITAEQAAQLITEHLGVTVRVPA